LKTSRKGSTNYRAKTLDAVRFLMDQHGLKQKDLVDVFGTPSIVSEVLSGKHELNKVRHFDSSLRPSCLP
jgi:antitoxin component HigA of HigAB toxin-antitoxin module